MKAIFFYHSLVSDWNHGNAHFLRGVVAELQDRGHDVTVLEPEDSWSRQSLVEEHGPDAIEQFHKAFPNLRYQHYSLERLDLGDILWEADIVLVHEWNNPELVARVGRWRRKHPRSLAFFHDTHHRSVTAPEQMSRYDLSGYDGVLAFGEVVRRIYVANGWAKRAWTWHEAADVRVFHPLPVDAPTREVLWIGNWGDHERSAEIEEFLLAPVRELGVRATIFGVRYPQEVLRQFAGSDIEYRGWLPNFVAPWEYSRHLLTVHIPRRPYVEALPGIPTIRPFEAMACGCPLLCSPWIDKEGLFRRGSDHLVAADGSQMTNLMRRLLKDRETRAALGREGVQTIGARHTCAHRVDELLRIAQEARVTVNYSATRESAFYA